MSKQLSLEFEFDDSPILPGKLSTENICVPVLKYNLFYCLPNCMGYHRTCIWSFRYDVKRILY